MGTEVLHPHDVLVDGFREPPVSFHRRRNFQGPDSVNRSMVVSRKPSQIVGGNKKAFVKPDKKKISSPSEIIATKRARNGSAAKVKKKDDGATGGLVMGKVTLLKRGESLNSLTLKNKAKSPEPTSPKPKSVDDLVVLGPESIGPDSPEMFPKQIRLYPTRFPDVYAGSAFYSSPSPRSLPLPSFFSKKQQDDDKIKPSDSATTDLRRFLRLD